MEAVWLGETVAAAAEAGALRRYRMCSISLTSIRLSNASLLATTAENALVIGRFPWPNAMHSSVRASEAASIAAADPRPTSAHCNCGCIATIWETFRETLSMSRDSPAYTTGSSRSGISRVEGGVRVQSPQKNFRSF